MRSNRTIPAKYELLDYVTKREFNDFKEEMRVFRDEMTGFRESTEQRFIQIDSRFDQVDKRFDHIDRRFIDIDRKFNILSSQLDQVREEFRVHTGAILEQMRHESKVALEYIQTAMVK